ncbi:MAG TPA: xanthine dehydrogenase family protein molybdopterin-binding subunit [Candidatus Binatia bacterium]|jgi:carbon-monoxide dehydrogenase large subunit|nr:xanthine dehydrogenase family protein molybdopterin-binding subunit [Candidatus Binatia bacterium]
MATSLVGTGKLVGAQVRRVEDPRVLLGKSRYVDDIHLPGTVALTFVRSPYAHARITRIDVSAAKAHPGVHAVLTGADVAGVIPPLRVELDPVRAPTHKSCDWPVLAQDKVRFVGEAVAAVVATDRYVAEDAAALVEVEYEPVDVVWDMEKALEPGSPLVHEEWGDNLMQVLQAEIGEVAKAFQEADCVIAERFVTGRHMALPMETRGCLANYEAAADSLTLWTSTQLPHVVRSHLAVILNFPEHHIRVIAPDVGGGFGLKAHIFAEEVLAVYLTRQLGRPVKWSEDRREHLTASLHAKHQVVQAELALKKDGTILGLTGRFISDVGAYSDYPWSAALEAGHAASAMPGPYKIPAYRFEALSVATNKTTIGPYRGVGLPIAVLVMERLLDLAAQKLSLDPAELRLRNMIRKEEHPYTTITGAEVESGSHQEALHKALEMLGYENFRAQQQRLRAQGRYIGVGLGCYIEGTAPSSAAFQAMGATIGGYESATVRMDVTGKVTILVGTHSHGQSHETTLAQVAADELGVLLADVKIIEGDTTAVPYGWGTWGSRSAVTGGGAIILASGKVREKLLRAASRLSEVPADDLELAAGVVRRKQDGVTLMSIKEIAQQILLARVAGEEPGLEATSHYEPPPSTHANATHLATVEVDIETGQVKLLRYIVVEDCGTIINPLVVDGQIQGGVAQGIGTALYEQALYDENGQFLTGTLMDYLVPTAADVPRVEIGHIESPSPYTPGGIKGMGEGGAIAPPAAIANAVTDALAPFGVRVNEIPLTPERVLNCIARGQNEK